MKSRAAIHAPDAGHLTVGERLADRAASSIGSWRFVITQSVLTVVWVVLNTVAFTGHWDPFPWILLNLCYSFQAGFTGPILLLANNRQAAKDRAMAAQDDEEIGLLLDMQREQMRHDEQTKKDLAAIARALKAEIGRR